MGAIIRVKREIPVEEPNESDLFYLFVFLEQQAHARDEFERILWENEEVDAYSLDSRCYGPGVLGVYWLSNAARELCLQPGMPGWTLAWKWAHLKNMGWPLKRFPGTMPRTVLRVRQL